MDRLLLSEGPIKSEGEKLQKCIRLPERSVTGIRLLQKGQDNSLGVSRVGLRGFLRPAEAFLIDFVVLGDQFNFRARQ